jgi:hypothetical protein
MYIPTRIKGEFVRFSVNSNQKVEVERIFRKY